MTLITDYSLHFCTLILFILVDDNDEDNVHFMHDDVFHKEEEDSSF